MGGDGGTFQYFVFVSGQEILSRKSTILSANAKNLAIPSYLEMKEINLPLVSIPRRVLCFPPTTPL